MFCHRCSEQGGRGAQRVSGRCAESRADGEYSRGGHGRDESLLRRQLRQYSSGSEVHHGRDGGTEQTKTTSQLMKS